MQCTTPVHVAAEQGSDHPGLLCSAPTLIALTLLHTPHVANQSRTVLIFFGTKPCAINKRAYFRSEKVSQRLPFYLFSLCQHRQL